MSRENLEVLRRALPESAPHGPEQVRELLREWSGAFDDFGFEAEEAFEVGSSVVVLLHQWGRGKATGASTESRTWQVFDFHNGKIVHCRGYATKAEALEAAGP